MIRKATVSDRESGRRLDDLLPLLFDGISKTEGRRIIDRGGCAVNGSMVRVASRLLKGGDLVEVGVMEPGRFRELELEPAALLLENEDLIAVNKPAGINSQRTPYQLKGTLEYWVTEYFRKLGLQEPARVIHRLDRGTSGVMLFPKHKRAAAWLSGLFHDGLVGKCYLALVSDAPAQESWSATGAIGKVGSGRYGVTDPGRPARTDFRLVASAEGLSLVEARPLTGRTHQIRVHLQAAGLPIVGDATYGGAEAQRMMLHCASLSFASPTGAPVTVNAPLDGAFGSLLAEHGLGRDATGSGG